MSGAGPSQRAGVAAWHASHDCATAHTAWFGARERSPVWRGDEASYGAAHARVRVRNGPARDLRCVDCGAQADHWTYNHLDPNERTGPHHGGSPVIMRYSTDESYYEPRCRSCHRRFDSQ